MSSSNVEITSKTRNFAEKNAGAVGNLRPLTSWLIVIGIGAFTAIFLFGALLYFVGPNGSWLDNLAERQFAAVFGLPLAALAALSLVIILEFKAGKVEFEALGFSFRGASGPIVMWVLCFLAITLAIKLLWQP